MSTRQQNRLKALLWTGEILLCLLLQTAVFGTMHLGIVPCIMPIVVCCIGLCEGAEKGGLYGLVAGCLWAWSTALSYRGAWWIVALTVLGIAAGLLSERYLANGWNTLVGISLIGVFLTEGMVMICNVLWGTMPAELLLKVLLPEMLISLVFCIGLFPLTRLISGIGGFHG